MDAMHGSVEHGLLGEGDAGRLQPGPEDGLCSRLNREAIDAGPGVLHAGH
jgi:hypothetical protein